MESETVMKKLFAIIFLIILPVCSFASEKPVWIEATGETYLGEIDTEVKERARRDAQKNALEKAVVVFIKSHTLKPTANWRKILYMPL